MPETPPDARLKKIGLSANWAVSEVDQLFTRLGRYTRFVLYSKWFLMLIALGLMGTLIGMPLLSKDRSGIRVSFVDKGNENAAASPVMSTPEYRGVTDKGEQFKVNGIRAVQITQAKIRLEQVEAQLVSLSGSWRSLTSDTADYDRDTKLLELNGKVTLVDDQGYSFTTERALIDTHSAHISGNQPIKGVGPLGNLLASSFEITDSGKHITFTGGTEQVHLHIDRTHTQKP